MARTERSQRLSTPSHVAVDWSQTRPGDRSVEVLLTCPICKGQRWQPAKWVRKRPRAGEFVGRCQACSKPPRVEAKGPEHPAVDGALARGTNGRLRAQVTCPACGAVRLVGLGPLRYRIAQGTFTGLCASDNAAAVRARRPAVAMTTPTAKPALAPTGVSGAVP